MARQIPERIKYVLGDNLIRARTDRDWTQAEAAKHLGFSVRQVQRLEAGANADITTVAKLALKYGMPEWHLLKPQGRKLDRRPGRPRKRRPVTVEGDGGPKNASAGKLAYRGGAA